MLNLNYGSCIILQYRKIKKPMQIIDSQNRREDLTQLLLARN
jgi:hypothetical protein